nr:MAG TPA: hypothetical protein [Caudoviricetes sp.]
MPIRKETGLAARLSRRPSRLFCHQETSSVFLYQEEYYQLLLPVRCSRANASCVLMFSCLP